MIQNPYLDAYTAADGGSTKWDYHNLTKGFNARRELAYRYAWAIPTDEAARVILKYTHNIVEIGAGSGYWAWFLTQHDADVIAFDNGDWDSNWTEIHYPVRKGDETEAAKYPHRALMLCWPMYDQPVAYNALKAYTGNLLIYIGEGYGGCTSDDAFHELLKAEWEEIEWVRIPQWETIHDRLYIYKRR